MRQRRSDNDCYCKKQETIKESQYFYPSTTSLMDHSPIHSSQSQKNSEEVEPSREKAIDRRSTTNDFDIESPDKQGFKTNDPESPLFTPDTQSAIENAEKILVEVQHKITEAAWLYSKTETKRRVKRKERYTDYLEPPLEDEKEEALYVRELVSSKLKEIEHGESESNSEGDEILKKKILEKRDERIARLSEPKFRIVKRCSNDIFYRQRYPPYSSIPYERVEYNDRKRTITRKGDEMKGDVGKIDDDNKRKMKSLTIQNGPSLNIDRELTKQNLGCVNISPDASFVRDNSNVNVYMFLHESCKNDKTSRDDNDIDRPKMKETIDEIDESSTRRNRSIVKDFGTVKRRDEIIEEDVTERYKSVSKDANDSYSKDPMIDVRRNDLSSEREINNGREGNEDQENVSKHLPRTGAERCSPSIGESNSSSICSDLYVKNIIPERGDIYINRIEPRVDDKYTKKLTKEDGAKVARKSRDDDDDDDNDKHDDRDDVNDENVNDHGGRIDIDPSEIISLDNIEVIEENDVKILKRNEGTNRGRTFETIHRHDLRRHGEKKLLYDRVDERFEYIRRKYKLNNDSSYGSRYESEDRSDESIEDSYNGIFNEIELNPPSIENFDEMLSVYDKTIERITMGGKKLDEMLEEFRLKLSVRSNNAKLPDNNDFTCSNLMAVKCDDTKLMKLNPSKLIYEHKGYDESTTLSLTDEAARIFIPEEDKLQINSLISNYRSPLTSELFNLKEETSILHTYPLVEKQNDKLFDKILTLDKSNLSSVESKNVHGVENKTLEIFSNNENCMACVPLAKNCRSIDNNDVLEENLRRNDDESNRASFDNEESLIPEAKKCLLKRQDQFVDDRSSLEKKIDFERTIFNSRTNVEYNPLIVQELIKHLKMLSNAYDHDVPAILKQFFTNPTSRETDLILDLLSIRKRDYESEQCFSVKAVARDNECKVQEDVISNKDSFDVIARSPMQCKRKSFETCRLNTVKIEDADKSSIDESNQNEIRLLEKSTQYDVSQERRDVLDCKDRIIKDVFFDGKSDEKVSDRKSDVEEYSAKLIREYYSNSTKLDLAVINDNTDRNDEGSDINTIVSNPHLTPKLIDKLSEGEEDCSNTSDANIENIPVTHIPATSSETSHSEGELYLPSSCSYSLGEVRIMKNSAAICNRALVSNSTLTCLCDNTSLLHYSSGEVSVDSTDIL